MPRKIHKLKTWQPSYDDIREGKKTFDFRKDDRGFNIGDLLILDEYDPVTKLYTNSSFAVVVVYLIRGGKFGIPEGFCIMGIEKDEN